MNCMGTFSSYGAVSTFCLRHANKSVLCLEIIAFCSGTRKKHIITLCEQKTEFFNVKCSDAQSSVSA